MTDPLPNPISPDPSPPATDAPALPAVAATPQPTRRNWLPLFLILAMLGIAICVCAGLCGATFGNSLYTAATQKDDVELVLDQLMTAMEAKDSQTAYALFSTRAQKQWGIEELDKLLEGNNYLIFKNYSRLTITNLNVTAAVNTNPDAPQGTVANIAAVVYYEDGFEGQMTAILEQDEGQWRLFGFNVVVPPDKFSQGDSAF